MIAENGKVVRVIEMVNNIVRSDGGDVQLESYEEETGEVAVRYVPGTNEECPECVVTPDHVRLFLMESFRRHGPQISNVHVITD